MRAADAVSGAAIHWTAWRLASRIGPVIATADTMNASIAS
jgi:hypothetical protein